MKLFRGAVLTLSGAMIVLFVGLVVAGRTDDRGLFRALGNLAEVVHLIQESYVDEVDLAQLEEGLERGLVESVDSWACIVDDPEAFEKLVSSPPAYGVVLTRRLGAAAVRQVLPGSPAESAELEAGVIIERINDRKTRLMPLWEVRGLLGNQEAEGDSVTLTVLTADVDDRRQVRIRSKDWTPNGVSVSTHDAVKVLRVWALPSGSAQAVHEQLRGDGVPILDLRELCWGFERETFAVADLFADEGVLARWQGRRAEGAVYEATSDSANGPPVVLIGRETEGLGEVLASALQRMGGTLIGQPTRGHAVHMGLIHQDGISVYIPIGLWLGPNDEPISGGGVTPDVSVKPSADGADDEALERALELVAKSDVDAA